MISTVLLAILGIAAIVGWIGVFPLIQIPVQP